MNCTEVWATACTVKEQRLWLHVPGRPSFAACPGHPWALQVPAFTRSSSAHRRSEVGQAPQVLSAQVTSVQQGLEPMLCSQSSTFPKCDSHRGPGCRTQPQRTLPISSVLLSPCVTIVTWYNYVLAGASHTSGHRLSTPSSSFPGRLKDGETIESCCSCGYAFQLNLFPVANSYFQK